MSRNMVAAVGGAVIFAVVVALGFHELGSPKTQRLKQIDGQTVRIISQVAEQTRQAYVAEKELPGDLSKVSVGKRNPANGEAIRYRIKTGSQYELCARFSTDNREQLGDNESGYKFWEHPAGNYCFSFEATGRVPGVPYNY
jgi:hypothetical protein